MPTWSSPISLRGPAGPAGSNATLPKNIVGNSLNIAPVSGETQAVQIGLQSANGTQNFLVDATGNLTTAGLATLKGAANVTGALTAGAVVTGPQMRTSSPGSAAAAAFGYAGNFKGADTVTVSGAYFGSNYGDVFESVGGYQARSATYLNGSPRDQGAGYVTHVFRSSIASTGVDAYRFQVGDSNVALKIGGNSAATLAGLLTTAGVTLSGGALTFADGTTLTTAPASSAAPTTFAATQVGTAASPAFRYGSATNGAGLFFDGALGNVSLSVNGYAALTSTAASGAASGASGWALRSTLGAGSAALAIFGSSSTTTAVLSIDGAGSVTAAALTLSGALQAASAKVTGLTTSAGVTLSSGSLTFADGTSMASAPAGSNTSFATTQTGTAASPAFRYGSATNGAGLFFDGALGNVSLSVNGYAAFTSTAASGAASGASGWAVRSTLGAGSQVLAVYGNASTTTPVWSVDGAGTISSTALTLSGALQAGSVKSTGLTTSAGVTLSSGALTFADGTQLTTAPTGGGATATYAATQTGTAASPAFRYGNANNGAGVYFDGAAGNVILSANGAKSLFTQAASGAASGASGVGVASTLGAGSQVWGVYGQGVDSTVTTNAQMSVDGAGNVAATSLTLKLGGAGVVTFADGTTQASAAGAASPTVPTNGPYLMHNGGFGPGASSGAGIALSATPVEVTDGLGNPVTYTPPITSGLIAALFVCSSASGTTTFELWDKTAGATVYKSAALGAGTLTNLPTSGSISQSTYPMIKGNVHVWRVTGSGTWQGHLTPSYWMQVAPPPPQYGCNPYPMFTWRNLQASSSAQAATYPNNSNLMYYRSQKGTTLSFVTLVNNATSGTVSFSLYDYTNSAVKFTPLDNAGATLALGPGQSVNTTVQNLALTAGTNYGWRVTGTANGNFSATMWVVQ